MSTCCKDWLLSAEAVPLSLVHCLPKPHWLRARLARQTIGGESVWRVEEFCQSISDSIFLEGYYPVNEVVLSFGTRISSVFFQRNLA